MEPTPAPVTEPLPPAASVAELETHLLAARETVAALTRTNTELKAVIEEMELQNKRIRRNSRRDESALRTEITGLQNRRG